MQIVRFPTGPDIDVAAARSTVFVIKGADNLEIVEGIGPRIAQLLRADGITTFAELAAALVARIQGVLDRGGPSFNLAKPESCPCGGLSQLTSVGESAVSGFHDPRGSLSTNQALSFNRATSVRDLLGTLGIAFDRVLLNKPQSTTGSGSLPEARRVEVSVQP